MNRGQQYRLPSLPYLRLRFRLIAQQSCRLPAFKGSLLRGAFGHALRRTVCIMGPQQPCQTCMLRFHCTYPRLFEPFIQGDAPRFLRGLDTAPRPYVIEPGVHKERFQQRDSLEFDFILIGRASELYPYVIFAVDRMAQSGLGRSRYHFLLEKVWWEKRPHGAITSSPLRPAGAESLRTGAAWRILYDSEARHLVDAPEPQAVFSPADTDVRGPGLPGADIQADFRTTLLFLTPTRLKFKSGLSMDFSFRHLVFKMLRRVLELAHFHVPEAAVDWEFHHLLVAADAVSILERKLKWVDWERRSNRQDTTMKMGGFVGELVLQGPLAPFWELLQTCEVVHIGKGTVFGNGKVILEHG